jgi:hypothetical protein
VDPLHEKLSTFDCSKCVQSLKDAYDKNPQAKIGKCESLYAKVEDVWKRLPNDVKELADKPRTLNNQEKLMCGILIYTRMKYDPNDEQAARYKASGDIKMMEYCQQESKKQEADYARDIHLWNVVTGKKYSLISKSNFLTQLYLWWHNVPPVSR